MLSEEDIDSAVTAGAISPEAAAALRTHVANLRHSSGADEEPFRLISGFNDVFVVVAGLLLLAALAVIGNTVSPLLGGALVAVASWFLSEYFVRQRRMALPAIVLLLTFIAGTFIGIFFGVFGHVLAGNIGWTTAFTVSTIAAAFAAWVHWRRFRVPITVAAGMFALVAAVIVLLIGSLESSSGLSLILFLSGMVVFAAALTWDLSDRRRETRRSDVAFWLHLLAAPLLVHPIFTYLDVPHGDVDAASATLVLFVYVIIALVSLYVDRRALMVSALGYVLYTFTTLIGEPRGGVPAFAVTALIVGSALLLLSAFWQRSRDFLIRGLPAELRRYVPETNRQGP